MYPRDILAAILTSVIMIAVFTFVSVAAWAEQRRREREALYRSEVLKKLAESTGEQAQQVIELIREQDRNEERKRREGGKLAGLIVTGVGLGLSAMFSLLAPGGVWGIGLILLFIGLALLLYHYVLARRPPEA
ncbi:MAG TPA: DUF6249 domain-containing protein [Thermoanaerobaculia bacterium]|jgi:Flp pilus assembly protein TadB